MVDNKTKNNFLIKIETIRKSSYGGSNFLKTGDIIVALNNLNFAHHYPSPISRNWGI